MNGREIGCRDSEQASKVKRGQESAKDIQRRMKRFRQKLVKQLCQYG